MKIRVEMDVSPDELRAFLGLPDVKPLQEEMMQKVREGLDSGTGGLDAVKMMQPFLAPNMQAMEGMQRAFWQAFSQASPMGWSSESGEKKTEDDGA